MSISMISLSMFIFIILELFSFSVSVSVSTYNKNNFYCERIIPSEDYQHFFNRGIVAYAEGNNEKAKMNFLCATRSAIWKYEAFLKLGIIYKETDDLSTAKYCLLKSLIGETALKPIDAIQAISLLANIYEIWENRFGYLFYSELVLLKEHQLSMSDNNDTSLTMRKDIWNIPDISKNASADIHSPFTCEGLLLMQSGDVSLVLTYAAMASRHFSDYTFHRISTYELYLQILQQSHRKCTSEVVDDPIYLFQAPRMYWPARHPIKILFDDIHGDAVFAETVEGLAAALERLGVSCKIVTHVSTADDDSLYIILFASTEAIKAKNYILWNFEKNPSVVLPGETVGFKHLEHGYLETVMFPPAVVQRALGIWDYSLSHRALWVGVFQTSLPPVGVHVFRPLISADTALDALIASRTTAIDELLPIDIIFFGSPNPHRQFINDKFTQLAHQHGLRIEFHRKSYGVERNALMESSKIVLNLANHPWPSDSHYKRCPVNIHRIVETLARGKVVLSERSGVPEDELLFNGAVVFADTDNLLSAALYLLGSPELRRWMEKKAAAFVAEDLGLVVAADAGRTSMARLALALRPVQHSVLQLLDDAPLCGSQDTLSQINSCSLEWASRAQIECVSYADCALQFLRRERTSRYLTRRRRETDAVISRDALSRTADVALVAAYLIQVYAYAAVVDVGCSAGSLPGFSGTLIRVCDATSIRDLGPGRFQMAILKYHSASFSAELASVLWILAEGGTLVVDNVCWSNCTGSEISPWYLDSALDEIDGAVAAPKAVAVVDVDWGVLVVRRGVSGDRREHSARLALAVDQFLPVLSLSELDRWLERLGS